ncbi:MAG: type II secretion system GspH family protein [Actinobacteria bacterium]|nr:type II secretion system GspH family protein [Actinomycetota bacterium]
MIRSFKERREQEEGFTLIELMVVVLIIAILLAIAIPTFLGARERAQDRAAQSDIRNALTAEKVFYTDNQTYTAGTAGIATIKSIEPSLTYTTSTTASKTDVGIFVSPNNLAVCIQKQSAGGTTFSVVDLSSGTGAGTYFAKQACGSAVTADLTAAPASPYKTGGW